MFPLFLFLVAIDTPFIEVKRFAPLPRDPGSFLRQPYSFDFGAEGRLYVTDRQNNNVVVWNRDGSYLKSFGRRGQGPGELNKPYQIKATETAVYVLDKSKKISVFEPDGSFRRSFGVSGRTIRRFAVLNDNLLLVFWHHYASPTDVRAVFELLDGSGKEVRVLDNHAYELLLAPIKGQNNTTMKAYAGDGDIQAAGDGTFYYGFGYNKRLTHIDSKGEIMGTTDFKLPLETPNAADKQLVESLTFPGSRGRRMSFSKLPNLKINFDHDKGYYYQFLIRGDRVLFVLTPLGGTLDIGNGYRAGTYLACDRETGELLARGSYDYPEDSYVLFKGGRVLGLILNEDGAYTVSELMERTSGK